MKSLRYYGFSKEEYSMCRPQVEDNKIKTSNYIIRMAFVFLSMLFAVSLFLEPLKSFTKIYAGFSLVF